MNLGAKDLLLFLPIRILDPVFKIQGARVVMNLTKV